VEPAPAHYSAMHGRRGFKPGFELRDTDPSRNRIAEAENWSTFGWGLLAAEWSSPKSWLDLGTLGRPLSAVN